MSTPRSEKILQFLKANWPMDWCEGPCGCTGKCVNFKMKIFREDHPDEHPISKEEFEIGRKQYGIDRVNEYAYERFLSINPNRWYLHTHDVSGADYGFTMTYAPDTGVWSIRTYQDSGYGPSKSILDTTDGSLVFTIIECFEPTNPNYKTN
jgi:hypothetical protein